MKNSDEQISFKCRLKAFCEEIISRRIAVSKAGMDAAQIAANGESKSSAGDKYETARAMSHLEKEMHARQYLNHGQELAALRAVKVDTVYSRVSPGAFIDCGTISFFLGAGLGEQYIDDKPVIFLSPASPLAKILTGKKPGDVFSFKGERKIVAVW